MATGLSYQQKNALKASWSRFHDNAVANGGGFYMWYVAVYSSVSNGFNHNHLEASKCGSSVAQLSFFLAYLTRISAWNQMSHVMRLWYFSSSVNSFFKRACAAIQWARCLIFGRTLRLLPYFMCAKSEGSDETAWMHRVAWAFAGRLCKYHNLAKILY